MSAVRHGNLVRTFHGEQHQNAPRRDPNRGNMDFVVDLGGTGAVSVLSNQCCRGKDATNISDWDCVAHVTGPRGITRLHRRTRPGPHGPAVVVAACDGGGILAGKCVW
ncbi:unnamed protein product, partial [Sphacelaria rigidula]